MKETEDNEIVDSIMLSKDEAKALTGIVRNSHSMSELVSNVLKAGVDKESSVRLAVCSALAIRAESYVDDTYTEEQEISDINDILLTKLNSKDVI